MATRTAPKPDDDTTSTSTAAGEHAANAATGRFDELASQVSQAATDALYVGVGFGVLAVQQLKNRQGELGELAQSAAPAIRRTLDAGKARLAPLADALDRPLPALDGTVTAVEARVTEVLDSVQATLPEPVATAVGQARQAAGAAVGTLRNRLRASA